MADTVKVSWSGGKDSTCAVMKHIMAGHNVKIVCYIPMFTETIPLILKDHYEHILRIAYVFRSLNAQVFIVHGRTYYDQVHTRSSRGKFKGRAFGFPPFQKGWCNFKRDSKIKALQQIDVGDYDYEDIGIAFDEKDRVAQLTALKRSILYETKTTEQMAREFCEASEYRLLSPHYSKYRRDGCVLCPNASEKERQEWYKQYPEAIDILIELQDFVKRERPDQTPLRNHRWFISEEVSE